VSSLAWAVVRGQDVPAGWDAPAGWDVAVGGCGGAGPRTIFQIGSVTKVSPRCLASTAPPAGPASPAAPPAGPASPAAPPAATASAATPVRSVAPPVPTALASAIRATLAPRRPIPGGEISLARHHTRRGDHTILWHNGMTGGFSAMIALDPARGLAVAALANSAGRPPSPLDEAVLSALH